jgi:hypothetical protein
MLRPICARLGKGIWRRRFSSGPAAAASDGAPFFALAKQFHADGAPFFALAKQFQTLLGILAGATVVGATIAAASMRNDIVAVELRGEMRNLEGTISERLRWQASTLGEKAAGLEGKLGVQMANLEGMVGVQMANLENKLGVQVANLEHLLEAKLANVTAGAAGKAEAATLRVLKEHGIIAAASGATGESLA